MTDPILYESLPSGIARIVLNRAETRNAQDTAFLYALNDAFDRAAQDDGVKVIVLSANGPHFSSGHDLREADGHGNMRKHETVGTWSGFGKPGAEAQYAREQEIYVGFCERWRNIPKPTLALVQGKVIAGGLMLIWPCDLIVAATMPSSSTTPSQWAWAARSSSPIPGSSACARPRSSCSPPTGSRPRRPIVSAWSTTSCRAPSSRASASPWPDASPRSPCLR
jgi:hypothetical protein